MIQSIPLKKLAASPRNVRKSSDVLADLQLRADIAARGLLQNLVVRKGKRGKFEVEAGGRRLAALQALAEEGTLSESHEVTCLVIEGEESEVREASLAENFQRLAMNPADEAQAFASIIEAGATTEDVARRFGLTVRFVEGRLRLASLASCVFEALAEGTITLDMAKAYGAISDVERQAHVYAELQDAWYQITPDTIRRMVLDATVRGSDPRAVLVGRDAYLAAGGRIERELFDDDASESWIDIALLEDLAHKAMEEAAEKAAIEYGLAWVRPTLGTYVSHDLVEGLGRLPCEPAPMTEQEVQELGELEADYDRVAAVLEDEDSDEDEIAKAEQELVVIDRAMRAINDRPPVLADELKAEAGAFLVLSRNGEPTLVPQFYTETEVIADEGVVEAIEESGAAKPKVSSLSQRLLDELAMQRRDILAVHLANDPALALDFMVFTLADADGHDWRARKASTLVGSIASGPVAGFEAKDAPASAALAEFAGSLDESWRSGETDVERFARFRSLSDEARSAWLGHVVSRTLVASLACEGDRSVPMHEALGALLEIETAHWWRPTAANYFDRVAKARTLEALDAAGGPELVSRYAASKKAGLASAAERIFSGNFIGEAEVKERAQAWVPAIMLFTAAQEVAPIGVEVDEAVSDDATDEIAEQAA
ncbi:chromosome partitioning protein ParB [Erythrobacter sp. HI0019]|uniref:ParB/RepB/Spo0J family partition protein n=1 Tax=unclassified Erythrobacter TaxID=2633097 RepID=UPI0007B92DFE|nr:MULTISPECIES: ParB/RepB/Spo0J family partition protein [unclassified Erythrobacter]KZX91066.1 chromosome partitioning protein ParB [Erythrobacter sp. HI0019]KZY09172.1 chromosome partitioning protein ParB [Erythrobacter sp. HI0028]